MSRNNTANILLVSLIVLIIAVYLVAGYAALPGSMAYPGFDWHKFFAALNGTLAILYILMLIFPRRILLLHVPVFLLQLSALVIFPHHNVLLPVQVGLGIFTCWLYWAKVKRGK